MERKRYRFLSSTYVWTGHDPVCVYRVGRCRHFDHERDLTGYAVDVVHGTRLHAREKAHVPRQVTK